LAIMEVSCQRRWREGDRRNTPDVPALVLPTAAVPALLLQIAVLRAGAETVVAVTTVAAKTVAAVEVAVAVAVASAVVVIAVSAAPPSAPDQTMTQGEGTCWVAAAVAGAGAKGVEWGCRGGTVGMGSAMVGIGLGGGRFAGDVVRATESDGATGRGGRPGTGG